jgi:hypothetical protein
MLSPDELADPERSFHRLLFAAQDMVECRAAIDFLHSRYDVPGHVWRALETGAVVAYARPWGHRNTIGALDDHWLPSDPKQLALHNALIRDRHRLYAHTDEDVKARWVKGLEWNAEAVQKFLPALRPLLLDQRPQIGELADAQKDRFVEGIGSLFAGLGTESVAQSLPKRPD